MHSNFVNVKVNDSADLILFAGSHKRVQRPCYVHILRSSAVTLRYVLRLVHFLWLAILPHDNCSEGPCGKDKSGIKLDITHIFQTSFNFVENTTGRQSAISEQLWPFLFLVCHPLLERVAPCRWFIHQLSTAAEPGSERNHSDRRFSSANRCSVKKPKKKKKKRERLLSVSLYYPWYHHLVHFLYLFTSAICYFLIRHILKADILTRGVWRNLLSSWQRFVYLQSGVSWFHFLTDKYRVLPPGGTVWRGIFSQTQNDGASWLESSRHVQVQLFGRETGDRV